MRIGSIAALTMVLAAGASYADAPDAPAIVWKVSATPSAAQSGDEIELRFVADLPDDLIVYASDFDATLGPRPTRVRFDENDAIELTGPVQAVRSQPGRDKTFDTEYTYFAGRAELVQKARLLKDGARVTGQIEGQTCQLKDGLCTLFKERFTVDLD